MAAAEHAHNTDFAAIFILFSKILVALSCHIPPRGGRQEDADFHPADAGNGIDELPVAKCVPIA
ncbi:MAG TPA: hypothetical protein VJ576_03010 [Rhodocyclaceae bacterium]|nr:hypothetical protein [Rhodocyclaceae bacterium]